jgi:hypothetical protein
MALRTAASATAYIQEEISSARLAVDELKNCIVRAVELVNSSKQKDHLYGVAGDILFIAPRALYKLENNINAAALACDKWDYEQLRQVIRPEKVEELERVLDGVRLNIPRRVGK